LCRSTRSCAPPTTSRRCSISLARHHCADIGCGVAQTSVATLLYTCSHSARPCF
jgi:hypothetical protein